MTEPEPFLIGNGKSPPSSPNDANGCDSGISMRVTMSESEKSTPRRKSPRPIMKDRVKSCNHLEELQRSLESTVEIEIIDRLASLQETLENVSERVDMVFDEMKRGRKAGRKTEAVNVIKKTVTSTDIFGNATTSLKLGSTESHSQHHRGSEARRRSSVHSTVRFQTKRSGSQVEEKADTRKSIYAEANFADLVATQDPSDAAKTCEEAQITQATTPGIVEPERDNHNHNHHHSHKHNHNHNHRDHNHHDHEELEKYIDTAKKERSTSILAVGSPGSANKRDPTARRTAMAPAQQWRLSTGSGVGVRSAQIFNVMKITKGRSQKLEKVWVLMDDRESSISALRFAKGVRAFIVFSVCVTFLQTTDPPAIPYFMAGVLETIIDVIFCLLITLRFIVCPSCKNFFRSPANYFDLTAIFSLALRASIGFHLDDTTRDQTAGRILLCLMPVVRLLMMVRHFEHFQILLGAFERAFEALPVLIYMLAVITLTAASFIFIVEPRDNIPHLPKAIWLSIVTMTTVGYGDVTPVTSRGHVVVSCLVLSSVLFMAMPLGIIGSAFNTTWNDRDRILLMQRTRYRLDQWGFTASDILVLFKLVDLDEDGLLNFEEFTRLIKRMQINLKDERIIHLFSLFDGDGSGYVDPQEFVRQLFPNTYREVFLDNSDEDDEPGTPQIADKR